VPPAGHHLTGAEVVVPERFDGPGERWLLSHADAAALLLVTLGLAARLLAARAPFFGPDESLFLQIASAPDLPGAYRVSLGNAHPPLFPLLLHFWKPLAGSEWQLRLLSVAFGTAFLWAAFRWAGALFGKTSALVALALLAFLPSLVILSAQLRGYALMLWLMAAALTALERAFEEGSAWRLGLFTAFTGLSLLTHYSALWFTLSVFVYATVRAGSERSPRRFVLAWVTSQAAIAALCLFLYVTHVSSLRGGALEQEAQTLWLRAGYFHPGQESALRFLARQTVALFQFLFSTPVAGIVALGLLLGAIAWLAGRRRPSAILLLLPFLFSAAAGLLGRYPYGGTRHSIDLVPFACAGIGVALARLSAERPWVAIAVAAVLAPAGFVVGW
jgi:uncharacterized membrane protein